MQNTLVKYSYANNYCCFTQLIWNSCMEDLYCKHLFQVQYYPSWPNLAFAYKTKFLNFSKSKNQVVICHLAYKKSENCLPTKMALNKYGLKICGISTISSKLTAP